MVRLGKRLQCIHDLVDPGSVVADIGCDHALLSIALIESKRACFCYACDVAKGPLERAKAAIVQAGLEDVITPLLNDGICGLPQTIDTIIIAGMGGQLIAEILSRRVLELGGVNLLLQPMTQAPYLRQWLCENRFAIRQERCAVAAGKAYAVIQAAFTGEKIPCPPLYALVGRSSEDEGEDAGTYLETLLGREEKRLKGLCASVSPNPAEIAEAETLIAGLREILAARKQKGE